MGTRDGLDTVKGDKASLFAATTSHDTSKLTNTLAVEYKYSRLFKSKFPSKKASRQFHLLLNDKINSHKNRFNNILPYNGNTRFNIKISGAGLSAVNFVHQHSISTNTRTSVLVQLLGPKEESRQLQFKNCSKCL